jgi:hypothetical protein
MLALPAGPGCALGVKRTPASAAYVDRIGGMIERDVRESLSEGRVLGA